jgi:hypothetical protein
VRNTAVNALMMTEAEAQQALQVMVKIPSMNFWLLLNTVSPAGAREENRQL